MANRKHYNSGTRNTLLTITLAAGCLPCRSVGLLNKRTETLQKKMREMKEEGVFKEYKGKQYKGKDRIWVLTVDGSDRSTEMYEEGIPTELQDLFKNVTIQDGYKVTTDTPYPKKLRVVRNAETMMFYYGIGAECIMGRYKDIREDKRTAGNLYYSSRELKGITVEGGLKADLDKSNKLNTTRVNGALLSDGGNYTVFNIGRTVSNYSLSGERKLKAYMDNILTEKDRSVTESTVLLANSMSVYENFISPPNQKIQMQLGGLEGVYKNIYSLTLDANGQRMMQIMMIKNWKEMIYSSVLTMEQRNGRTGNIECDGQKGEQYIFVFCVPDIKRFKMFLRRAEIENDKRKYTVMCFDMHKDLVTKMVKGYAKVYSTSFMDYYHSMIPQNEQI